jgi:hypothetical protein
MLQPRALWHAITRVTGRRRPLSHRELGALFRAAAHLQSDTLKGAARKLAVSFNHLSLAIAGDRIAGSGLRARLAAYCGVPLGAIPTSHRPGAKIRK